MAVSPFERQMRDLHGSEAEIIELEVSPPAPRPRQLRRPAAATSQQGPAGPVAWQMAPRRPLRRWWTAATPLERFFRLWQLAVVAVVFGGIGVIVVVLISPT
jgi:hypothetical protein